MRRILLYSPDVIGHPRVYCRVISDALLGTDCDLVLAMGFTDDVSLDDSPDLWPLKARPGVTIVDTRSFSAGASPHLRAEELLKLQVAHGVETTLFIEADKSNDEFRRIASNLAPRLHGRNIGIFAKTAEWYPGEDSFTGERLRLQASTVRTTLGNLKRAVFHRKRTARYFYEKIILGANVLDELIVKDERLADWYGPPIHWLPEISRPVDVAESAEDVAEFELRSHELTNFLAQNNGREPVLYFGDAAFYKGYDWFLQFVEKVPSACAIHAGRSYNLTQAQYFDSGFEQTRIRLKAEGRLYETNSYVHSQRLKELFFSSVRVYLTTHRLALSSSTMIQALELGKPVIVPDRGLIGHRVKTHSLGGVYKYGDVADLAKVANQMWQSDLTRFKAPIRSFWERFSDEQVQRFFQQRLT